MSTDKYLDLDIKRLFEEHTIKDIELIQKQIQHESDRKKIELRTLVGERYRDLIQAADTIAEMKQTSESVVNRMADIEKTFHELQQKYLIGFKMEVDQKSLQRETSCLSDAVVMQIKILMDVPEQIWSAIDDKNFLFATQLFLLARHINYSLAFEVGDSTLAIKYPIVSKQWGIISQFKNLLLNFCNDALQSIELSKEVAANCLAALVLLEGLNSSELLNRLITFRSQTVQSIITSENDLSVKNKIKLCLNVMMEAIPLISSCFIKYKDNEDGLVTLYINGIKDKDALHMLSQLDVDRELLNKFLPIIAKNHKPFEQHELHKIPLESIRDAVNTWFNWVKELSKVEVKKLFNLVTSVKGIYNIREDCLAVAIPENWESIWESFSLPSIDFWMEFFQPLLTERVKDILSEKLNVCLIDLKRDFIELLNNVSYESCQFPEHDLTWFVWQDSPSDIPQKLLDSGTSDNKRPLLMKARGFSPNISKLCENFENALSELLIQIKQYLYELEATSEMKDDLLVSDIYMNTNKFCDRSEIQEYLQLISEKLMDEFIVFVKQECIIELPKTGRQDINAIVTARFLQAVPLLCTHFKECFTISRSTGLTLTNVKWQEVCDKLKQESTSIWSLWAKCFTRKLPEHRKKHLIKENAEEIRFNTIITDWEKVTIEEEAEEGKRIKSEILVPYQPGVHLQMYLASVCQDLNKAIPHTIPKSVLNDISHSIAVELLDYYSRIATLEIRQKQAIQILFDIKFISLLMVPRDNKSLSEQSNKVSNSVKSKIDPFDFDVFYPFINTNVKRAVQRTLLLYGNLVPHMEQLHSLLGARIEHNEGTKSVKDPPGILALCTGAPWFPPLAVTAPVKNIPATAPNLEKAQQKKKPPGKDHSRSDSTGSTIKSGAAAFFGAMGGEWFGTS